MASLPSFPLPWERVGWWASQIMNNCDLVACWPAGVMTDCYWYRCSAMIRSWSGQSGLHSGVTLHWLESCLAPGRLNISTSSRQQTRVCGKSIEGQSGPLSGSTWCSNRGRVLLLLTDELRIKMENIKFRPERLQTNWGWINEFGMQWKPWNKR